MSGIALKSIAARVLGTVVLAAGMLFFVARAPFLTAPESNDTVQVPVADEPPSVRQAVDAAHGYALGANGLSGPAALQSTFGLFDADFAEFGDDLGFNTREFAVPGECKDAGRRFIDRECPDCGLLGDAGTSDMLLWQQAIDGEMAVRSVSRHCLRVSPDGQAIVGTVTFGDEKIDLAPQASNAGSGQVPLIAGATRLASIRLGLWSATYDRVPQPSSALREMASALLMRGWREVSDNEHLPQDAFDGQRVFTNDGSAVCVISLTREGQDYQLLTIISVRA